MLDPEVRSILEDLDVESAERRVFKVANFVTSDTRNSLAGMHKARLAYRDVFTEAEIAESEAWLDANGFRRTIGERE